MNRDFTSFKFDETTSEDLGILRVSDGSRYNEELVPAFQDRTAQIEGNNGVYYWGTNYTSKLININFAFDNLTEAQFRTLRNTFRPDNGIHSLIFAEKPYKTYKVKITTPPSIKYICFEENNQNIYKGEGALTFTAFYPFAVSTFKYLNQYIDAYPNIAGDEGNINLWQDSSGMLQEQETYDIVGTSINIYNPGDLETDFQIYYDISGTTMSSSMNIDIGLGSETLLEIDGLYSQANDNHICINSKTELIEGGDMNNNIFTPSGKLYNKFITGGDFFKIPVTSGEVLTSTPSCKKIEYNYLYF